MTQNVGLSQRAQEIINSYFERRRKQNGPLYESNLELMVSLYSVMPNSKSHILNLLGDYNAILSDHLADSDIQLLKSEYKEVVRFCFENPNLRKVWASDYKYKNRFVPCSLIDLCVKISQPKSHSTVYVPYLGDGGFAYQLADYSVEGFESEPKLWALSQIVLDSQNQNHSIKLSNEPVHNDKKYDYIYTSLLGSRRISSTKEYADMLYHLITNQLNDGGELLCLVPDGFLYDSEDEPIRRLLMDENRYSLKVVTIGKRMELGHLGGVSIVSIRRDFKGEVILVDTLDEIFWDKLRGFRNYKPKSDLIIDAINRRDSRYVWTGSYDQLYSHINLHPSRYLMEQNRPKPKSGERAYRLDELIEVIDPVVDESVKHLVDTIGLLRKNNPIVQNWSDKQREEFDAKVKAQEAKGIRQIGYDSLSDNYLNCVVDYQDIPIVNDVYAHLAPISTECLLLSTMGDDVKVGRLQGASDDMVVSLDCVLPFRVKTEIVSENFLLRSLLSESVQQQVEILGRTARWRRSITRENIHSIVIHVPEKELQEETLREDTRQYLAEADRKLLEQYDDFRRDIHMKKHAIGQTLNNFSTWWGNLQQARREGNGVVSDTAVVGKISKYEVRTIYDIIDGIVKILTEQIHKFDRGYKMQKECFNLSDFINDYITDNPSTMFVYEFESYIPKPSCEVESDNTREEDSQNGEGCVDFPKEALKIIFDNIVSNACCHGFGGDRNDYVIRIELTCEGDSYVVNISNNGAALYRGLDPKEVFVYAGTSKRGLNVSKDGVHQHCGIGGYEVKQLMHEFGGSAEFISKPDEEYPITYRLTFKMSNPNSNTNGDVQSTLDR